MTDSAVTGPRIEALLNADPTGVVIIDGVGHDVSGGDERALRAEIVALVSATAADVGHPVQLTTRHPGGVRRELVHPDGRVEEPAAAPREVADDTNEVPTVGSWAVTTPPVPSWAPVVPSAKPASEGESEAKSEAESERTPAPPAVTDPRPEPEAQPTEAQPAATPDATTPPQADHASEPVDDSLDESTITRPLGGSAFGVTPPPAPPAATADTPPADAPPADAPPADAPSSSTPPTELRRPRTHAERISPPPAAPAPEPPAAEPTSPPAAPPASAAPAAPGVEALIQPVAPPPPAPEDLTAASSPAAAPLLPSNQPLTVRPTLNDFLSTRPTAPSGPATMGWRGSLRRATGNLLRPGPGREEKRHRADVERVQKALTGPRTIVVINPKGGAHKTTATLLLAATFGRHRGGSTLAWDNNETRGTLGWRALSGDHHRTAVDLLHDLSRFEDPRSSQIGALDNYVRAQGSSQFDVLASDEDAAASSTINASAFTQLHDTLSRFYRVLVVDTGNNMRASNWLAAVEAADQLVIVSTKREDTAASAAWLVDGLFEKGHEEKVRQAVTVLASPAKNVDAALDKRLHTHFASVTRSVLDVPYDPALVSGGTIDVARLSPATREAWLHVAATVADGL